MDSSSLILLREPVIRSLEEADRLLKEYGFKVLVVDGFRSVFTQAALWKHTLRRICQGKDPDKLSIRALLTLGQQADEIGSYAPVLENGTYWQLFDHFRENSPEWFSLVEYAQTKFHTGKMTEEWLALYITLKANLGLLPSLLLDTAGHTSHGNGGTEDSLLISLKDGEVAGLGTPYDYPGKASAIDFFEHQENLEAWRLSQANDREMTKYLSECGINRPVTLNDFERIRGIRRIFYWAMEKVGVGRYGPEYWHRTHGNSRGGKQADQYPGAGNSCHAITRDIRDSDGQYLAVWGNKTAHEMAAAF